MATVINSVPAWVIVAATLLAAIVAGLLVYRFLFLTLEKWLRSTENFAWLLVLKKLRAPSALGTVIFFATSLLQLTPISGALPRFSRSRSASRCHCATYVDCDRYYRNLWFGVSSSSSSQRGEQPSCAQARHASANIETCRSHRDCRDRHRSFDAVRQYGVSLFASAGVAGLAVGLAARPLLSNLIAGVQITMTQPIRVQDVIIVGGGIRHRRGNHLNLRRDTVVGLAQNGSPPKLLHRKAVPKLDQREFIHHRRCHLQRRLFDGRPNDTLETKRDSRRQSEVGPPRRQSSGYRPYRGDHPVASACERCNIRRRMGPQM
ncbi:hypothetical protein V1279_006483 [Bradyrhizobium sp. AZCC 1610]